MAGRWSQTPSCFSAWRSPSPWRPRSRRHKASRCRGSALKHVFEPEGASLRPLDKLQACHAPTMNAFGAAAADARAPALRPGAGRPSGDASALADRQPDEAGTSSPFAVQPPIRNAISQPHGARSPVFLGAAWSMRRGDGCDQRIPYHATYNAGEQVYSPFSRRDQARF